MPFWYINFQQSPLLTPSSDSVISFPRFAAPPPPPSLKNPGYPTGKWDTMKYRVRSDNNTWRSVPHPVRLVVSLTTSVAVSSTPWQSVVLSFSNWNCSPAMPPVRRPVGTSTIIWVSVHVRKIPSVDSNSGARRTDAAEIVTLIIMNITEIHCGCCLYVYLFVFLLIHQLICVSFSCTNVVHILKWFNLLHNCRSMTSHHMHLIKYLNIKYV